MASDNLPVDFKYISSRLVKEIVQQHEAALPRTEKSLGMKAMLFTIGLAKKAPDYQNRYDLALRATDAIFDQTGTLEYPGTYVRAEFQITTGLLEVLLGWETARHVKIAAMMGDAEVPGVGNVLVTLFESIGNYTWRQARREPLSEIPSDVAGLYAIVERTRESKDPVPRDDYVESEDDIIPESRADTVVRLLQDRFEGFASNRLDVLMEVFYRIDNFSYGDTHYERVLIGAPVWVRTPLPHPLLTK